MVYDPPSITAAYRLREAEHDRLMAEKTRPAREAAERERAMRAELHRLLALPVLADALAGVVFDHIEANGRRPIVRDQLAAALHARLLKSGLARDPRCPSPSGSSQR